MTKTTSLLFIATLLGLGLNAAPAQAQLARTYVSSLGNDANDCNRLTPCRTFQRAHNQTLPTGEITVLDPGGYGAVTINRTISIINDGVGEAGVLVSGGLVGITINAGANDRVSLRGLTVKGLDPAFGGSNGIRFNSGASLTIENCVIRNNSGDGIQVLGKMAEGTRSTFTVSNTLVADNGGNGIYIQPTGTGQLRFSFNRVEAYNNNAHGIGVAGGHMSISGLASGIFGTLVDSVAAHNGLSGVASSTVANTGGRVVVGVYRSAFMFNGTGVFGENVSAVVFVGGSTVAGNDKNIDGSVQSYGDNYVPTLSNPFTFANNIPKW